LWYLQEPQNVQLVVPLGNRVAIKLDGEGALFEQLARALKNGILAGRFAAGSLLPATRTLAIAMGISRNTAIAAYELLCAEQLAVAQPGSGTRVGDVKTPAASGVAHGLLEPQSRYSARTRLLEPIALAGGRSGLKYDFQYGAPSVRPKVFASWRRKYVAAATRVGPLYPQAEGLLALRRAIAGYLLRRRGVSCQPESIIIVGGTQQALTLTARVVLNEGQSAVLEDPHYQYARYTLLAHGARVQSVPVDSEGIITAALPQRPPRLIYVTPSHQFPSGVTMSLARRLELLNYAAKHDCWIFEDDYDGEFHYEGRPLPALRSLDVNGRVLYTGTFSKTLFPGLRLGYVVSPAPILQDFYQAKRLDDLGCSAIDQTALATFLESRLYDKHLRQSLVELRLRRKALLEGIALHIGDRVRVAPSSGGMHIIIWFRDLKWTAFDRVLKRGAEQGVGLHPIHPFYKSRPPKPGLMLGYAGLAPDAIHTATRILARIIREVV
jgi:GntR family transcriptional regulator / MocR family aminotransferase